MRHHKSIKGLEENNLYEFPKTMGKPAILFGKRSNFLPAPKKAGV